MNVEQILRHLNVDGFCVVKGLIPRDKVDAIRDSVLATVASTGTRGGTGVDANYGLISNDQSFAPYLADSRILSVTKALFGDNVRISFTTAILNTPGNSRGAWHADWPFNQGNAGHIPAPYPDVVQHLTTIWMLSVFSAETSGTLLVPGSHHSDNNPSGDNGVDAMAPYATEIQATGEPGDILMFDSRLWHATAANPSDSTRVGIAVRYAP